MTNESEVCTIFKNSLKALGEEAEKIPDPSSEFSATIQRPFDMFGTYKGNPLYSEVKFQRGMKSFDLQRIQDHQIQALLRFKNKLPNAECWIVLGVKVENRDNRLYFFEASLIEWRRNNKSNFLKKELETLPYLKVHKKLVDFLGDFRLIR